MDAKQAKREANYEELIAITKVNKEKLRPARNTRKPK
jgi:hypothetical protein